MMIQQREPSRHAWTIGANDGPILAGAQDFESLEIAAMEIKVFSFANRKWC